MCLIIKHCITTFFFLIFGLNLKIMLSEHKNILLCKSPFGALLMFKLLDISFLTAFDVTTDQNKGEI